jgi:hypothetical protein
MKTFVLAAALAGLAATVMAEPSTVTSSRRPSSNGQPSASPSGKHAASAQYVPWSNGTHFTDPATNSTVKHFDCDVHQGKASAHFNTTVKQLHGARGASKAGSRFARSLIKKQTVSTPFTVPLYIHVIYGSGEDGKSTIWTSGQRRHQ